MAVSFESTGRNWTRAILCAVTAALFGALVLTVGCSDDSDSGNQSQPPETYLVVVTDGEGDGYYKPGEVVNIRADAPPPGHKFVFWQSESVKFADSGSYVTTFTMPAKDVYATATFEPDIDAPTGMMATVVSSSSVTITWDAVPKATGYKVYRNIWGEDEYQEIGTTTTTSFTVDNLSSGTLYGYGVQAYNSLVDAIQWGRIGAQTFIDPATVVKGTMKDPRDNNKEYKTVKIGNQTWMAENLDYEPDTGNSWCYENSADSCGKYGRLYDGKTAMAGSASSEANPSGVRGVCPAGWHLPSAAEWDELKIAVEGLPASNVAGKKLKSKSGWFDKGNGTDDYGFSALPGKARWSHTAYDEDNWNDVVQTIWWTATKFDANNVYARSIGNDDDYLQGNSIQDEDYGLSVRCVKD